MAKSKSKLNKNQNKSKLELENLKPLEIEETIEKLPTRTRSLLDDLLDDFSVEVLPKNLGDKITQLFEFYDEDEDEDDDFDEDEDDEELKQDIMRILETNNIEVNKTNLKKYLSFLKKNLKFPCLVVGEQVYTDDDYPQLGKGKKQSNVTVTMAVEEQLYNLVGLNDNLDDKYGILAEVEVKTKGVRRANDKQRLTVPLAQLEVQNVMSDNFELLIDYAIWFFDELN